MLEKQQHEQDHGRMNAIKIHNQWRRIMRMAKTEELKQDIEILSQSFDRNVDRKDALIQVSPFALLQCSMSASYHHTIIVVRSSLLSWVCSVLEMVSSWTLLRVLE